MNDEQDIIITPINENENQEPMTVIKEETKKEYLTRLKLIPYSSLGKQNGMLVGIKPEYIEIENEEQIKKIENVIIGIYNKSLTKKGEYRALVGIELL